MGNKRVDEPVITINAMVKVGPWTVERVDYGEWRRCRRCKTPHKEVWVCTIDPQVNDATVAARLEGDRTWRVGSTCGPTLEMVSDHNWVGTTAELRKKVRLAVDATRAISGGRASAHEWHFLHLVEAWLPKLLDGTLDPRLQRPMRSHVNGVLNRLKRDAWDAEQAKAPPWRHRPPGMPT